MYLHERLSKRQEGFTLIELMIVVLIIAVLLAIAIPTFLGARKRAQDRGAQSNLRNGLSAAKTFFTDAQTFVGFTNTKGEELEPSLTWEALAAAPATEGTVGIVTAETSATTLHLVSKSKSGKFFCIREAGSGSTFGGGDAYGDVDAAADCAGSGW